MTSWQGTILVVDDEDIVRMLVSRTLREAGYRVLQASHGTAAVGILETEAQSGPGDLRSGDADSGGPRGVGVDAGALPGLPLLFISGYPRAYLEANYLYDPSVPMLRKPFLPSRLLESVEERLAGRPTPRRRVEGG